MNENHKSHDTPLHLEYVASAVGQTAVFNTTFTESTIFQSKIVPAIKDLIDILLNDVYAHCTTTESEFSILFNAYTENRFIKGFSMYDNFSAHSVYADSGGLQMVTAGKTITDEIKEKIYATQCYADYAMCFDVIPLESLSLVRTKNERSNVENKIFDQSRHLDAGKQTGQNIKKQIEHFKKAEAKTKVIIIVQGNTPEDMVDYFCQIQDQLDDEDFSYVGGIAVADTCMGNKELETIDMLIAARKIAEVSKYPECTSKHLHFLGIGAIPRMAPVLYLQKSGFLDSYKKISYDSSSHTHCFIHGLMKLNGGCIKQGSKRNPKIEKTMKDIHSLLLKPVFDKYGVSTDYSWYANEVFFDPVDGNWVDSKIRERVRNKNDEDVTLAAALTSFSYFLYQCRNFMINLDKVAAGEFIGKRSIMNQKAIEELKKVTNEEDMTEWKRLYKRYVSSARIKRKEDAFGLNHFF